MTRSTVAVRFVEVDFDRKLARIAVSPIVAHDTDRLERITWACRARGLTPIVTVGDGIGHGTPAWSCRDIGDDGCGVEYSIRIDRLTDALEHVTTAAVLIGEACDMDEVTRKHLQFCVYELVINTIEHGVFAAAEPVVRIQLKLDELAVQVMYRDNGHPFATDDPANVDVDKKVANGDKGGFGLFLLQKLARVEYKRDDGWNTTTLTLASRSQSGTTIKRSVAMEGITIEIIPCSMKNTAVIKMIGNIDSSTAETVETHFRNLVLQGSRRLVVDLSQLEFISSAGIGILLGTAAQLRGAGGDLLFMNLPRHVEELFDMINLKSFFTVVGSLDELQATTGR